MFDSISKEEWTDNYSNFMKNLSNRLDERLNSEVNYHDPLCIEIEGEADRYYVELTNVKSPYSQINVLKLRYSDRTELRLEDSRWLNSEEFEDRNLEEHVSAIEERVKDWEVNPPQDSIDRRLL